MTTHTHEITLSVPDVSCEHCVKTINQALGSLDGVQSVNTDIPTKSVHLNYDPSHISLEKIEEVLDDAGYTVAR
ncbi:heavy-metal-associated domain-containing protein [Dictyobacter aurantiacus]|uniref:Copper chaperone CopZ n=1 Tax=Dictyobacter aurantiacus TaxID=1936993 RepID=A0A401ZME5_9CHLR|nr:heavy-metal-associated domain-containing protein [Dictyobacter aurantiacus]GCE07994.1 copper chaperone CopZ [Dictyobacter aurantiacus]